MASPTDGASVAITYAKEASAASAVVKAAADVEAVKGAVEKTVATRASRHRGALAATVAGRSHEPDPGELSRLLHGLAAFLREHRWCGELAGGADGEWVWMTCRCGAVISRTLETRTPAVAQASAAMFARRITPEEVDADCSRRTAPD